MGCSSSCGCWEKAQVSQIPANKCLSINFLQVTQYLTLAVFKTKIGQTHIRWGMSCSCYTPYPQLAKNAILHLNPPRSASLHWCQRFQHLLYLSQSLWFCPLAFWEHELPELWRPPAPEQGGECRLDLSLTAAEVEGFLWQLWEPDL